MSSTVLCNLKQIEYEKHFVTIPGKWMEDFTLLLFEVPVIKLIKDGKPIFLSVGKSNEETDTIEVGSMLGLRSCSGVRLEKPRRDEIGSAERVSVSPVSPADWDIIKLNQNGVEKSILEQVRVFQRKSIIQIYVKSIKLRLKVVAIIPDKPAVILQQSTELEIINPFEDDEDGFEISEDEIEELDQPPPTIDQTNKTKFSAFPFFDWFANKSSDKSVQKKQTPNLFSTKLKGFFRVEVDSSITVSTLCRISSFETSKPYFFAQLSGLEKKKEDGSNEMTSVYVRVDMCENLKPGTVYLSPLLIHYKHLAIGSQIFLQSLTADQTKYNLVIEIKLKTLFQNSDKHTFEVDFQELLEKDSHIFSDQCPLAVNNCTATVSVEPELKFIITTPGCRVSVQSDSIKSDVNYKNPELTFYKNKEKYVSDIFLEQLETCERFISASIGLNNTISRSVHLLVTGGSGSGKTTFVGILSEKFYLSRFTVSSVYINCTVLKNKRLDFVKSKIRGGVEEILTLKPGILILDNLECIACPPQEENQDETSTIISSWIKELLNSLPRGIMVVGIAESVDSLNPQLQSKKGSIPFLYTVNLTPPSALERDKLVKFYLKDTFSALDFVSLESFYPCDIRMLCDKILSLGDIIQPETLQGEIDDFTPLSRWGKPLKPAIKRDLDDVGGLELAKNTLIQTLIWPILHQDIYRRIGVRMPKGVLLYGVPGTGKTLLAESIASYSNLNYISIKGPELLSKYIGASERNVRDIFLRAQAAKPCLLFFDEFDSLAPRRGHDSTGVTDRVVNQLLTQLDGVEGLDGVWIIAASSRPDLIDPALLRPGRIDKSVLCPLPGAEDRLDILRKLSKDLDNDDCVDLPAVADLTGGLSGADLKAVLYTAQQTSINKNESLSRDKVQGRDEISKVWITQESLLQAVGETKPSVSAADLNKYITVYSNFKSGKTQSMSQRTTLA